MDKSPCVGRHKDGQTDDLESKGLGTNTGLVTLHVEKWLPSDAAILITHKPTLLLLVPLPFETEIRLICSSGVNLAFGRLVRLDEKINLQKSS